MAIVIPFKGTLYNLEVVGDIQGVVIEEESDNETYGARLAW